MNLEVNLEGSGVAQRTGTLWAENFVLLGDLIGGDLLCSRPMAPCGRGSAEKRGIVREQFAFETLRVPFSVGHGQFLLNEARLDGPVLSANMRGKIDFRSQNLNVGGTFTPLAGLNTIAWPAPFGPLLTGPRGDGVFGDDVRHSRLHERTANHRQSVLRDYAGVTREIMQMAPETQRIVPRDRPQGRSEAGPRASSAPAAATSNNGFEARVQPEIGGGWSADGEPAAAAKKR